VIADAGSFVVAPTKGALVPGWLLVVSKRHALCTGAFSDDEFESLASALSIARALIGARFGPATVFEHGPSAPGTAIGCGIDHAHVHVAALPFSLRAATEDYLGAIRWTSISGIRATRQLHVEGQEYALVAEAGMQACWFAPPQGTRQLLRRVIASRLGMPELFDYERHAHEKNVRDALGAFRAGVEA
jgi:hypothetical protein